MAININVNGESINYPQTGDINWSDEATDFAVQTASAFGKIGLSSGTTVDIPGTLDVTGNTTLDANLSVAGNATITGNLTANGNSNLGNASGDTIAVTGILNVDSGVLYVNPTSNQVGINKTNPSQALDVTGNVAITGNETVGGTLGVTGDVAVNTNKFNITATSGNTAIAGTLGVTGDVAINTNKFNVMASSGNTTVAGTLGVTGDATLTGRLLNSNGSAASPSVSFSSDNDNGFYYIGANNFGVSIGGSKIGEFGSNGLMILQPYWNIVDQKASGTGGGNTVASTWTKRTLNTTIGSNTISGSSLASDVITLPAGTYRIFATSIFVGGNTKIRLRNTTDGTTTIVGTSLTSTSSQTANNVNSLSGTFTIASTKNYELQYWASNALTNGLGVATISGEVEIYSIVELWRMA